MMFISLNHFSRSSNNLFKTTKVAQPTYPVPKIIDSGLATQIHTLTNNSTTSLAVDITNLKTGQSYFLNEHQSFEAGSLYKLWVMAEVYSEIQKNSLHLNDTLNKGIPDLNTEFGISPDEADSTEGTLTLTVQEALNQMITVSNNDAALLLTDKITLPIVADFLNKNGFSESKLGLNGDSPTTTASDIALFFEKLYQNQLVDNASSTQMLDLLKNQQLNNKIPKYLPQNTIIAHKTGEITTFTHDAGIVFSPKGDYIIVVLGSDPTPSNAEELIAKISQTAFNYFN